MKRRIIGTAIVLSVATFTGLAVASNSPQFQNSSTNPLVEVVEETVVPNADPPTAVNEEPAPGVETTQPAVNEPVMPPATEPDEAPAPPQPEPVTLTSCKVRMVDTGAEGSKERYEWYRDCAYSDASTTSELAGKSSSPNVSVL